MSKEQRSPKNVGNKVSGVNEDSDELLQIKRRQWEESTAKRIHVVVRARPLNIREIKSDCRVRISVGGTFIAQHLITKFLHFEDFGLGPNI